MWKFFFIISALFFCIFFLLAKASFATEDPLSLPNNKFGVHILFPDELNKAAELVNANGGDWGYITIPIQAGNRDIDKWQEFMDKAGELHIIPIIRLATESDYFNAGIWKKSLKEDVLDFANFLNSLNWPVKNRYVVVFNEANRGDEWDGSLNPEEYAQILRYATEIFKSLSPDFFIISAGLDNAAKNDSHKYMNEYDYMIAMNNAVPGIFGLIDGLGSHSYPNPGFKQMPDILTSESIYSFHFEKSLAHRLSGKNLPVFITETGWTKDALSETQISQYFKYAFDHVWTDENIVAVTPFLLRAGTKPFSQFSLIKEDGTDGKIFLTLQESPKIKGQPTINQQTGFSYADYSGENLPVGIFPEKKQYKDFPLRKIEIASNFLKWFLRLP